jgi:hypothetical protein
MACSNNETSNIFKKNTFFFALKIFVFCIGNSFFLILIRLLLIIYEVDTQ